REDDPAAYPTRRAPPREDRRGDELQRGRRGQQFPPVGTVGELPRGQREQERGNELREAHEPQVPRARGDVVDLPRERDQQDLVRRGGKHPRPEEEVEAARKRSEERRVG